MKNSEKITEDIFCEQNFSSFHSSIYNKDLNSQECKEFLIEVRDILNKKNINYFLLFGTLLGAYREKDFIKHDKDIDIGIFLDSKNDLEDLVLQGVFAEKNIKFFKDRGYSLQKGDSYMDIYPFTMDGDEYRSLLGWEYNYRLKKKYFPTERIEFVGEEFETISNIEDYLIEKYGENWRTPIKGISASS